MTAPVTSLVRPYRATDRLAIRTIACDTAFRGRPIDPLFPDREIVADILTTYYTEYEPRAIWVAESEGRVVGYLTGCLDSRRYRNIMAWQILPSTLLRAIGRGALFRRETWRLCQSAFLTWRHGGFERRIPLERYPAHLHINVRDGFRGRAVGRELVERFLEQVRAAHLKGVHAAVSRENPRARRFFERLGFRVLSRHAVLAPQTDRPRPSATVIYAKTLE